MGSVGPPVTKNSTKVKYIKQFSLNVIYPKGALILYSQHCVISLGEDTFVINKSEKQSVMNFREKILLLPVWVIRK